jgi:hypothetical protein
MPCIVHTQHQVQNASAVHIRCINMTHPPWQLCLEECFLVFQLLMFALFLLHQGREGSTLGHGRGILLRHCSVQILLLDHQPLLFQRDSPQSFGLHGCVATPERSMNETRPSSVIGKYMYIVPCVWRC